MLLSYIFSRLEAKAFNNGICKNCGEKLVNFDMDSQGGRGYTCWVSYKCVDKNFGRR